MSRDDLTAKEKGRQSESTVIERSSARSAARLGNSFPWLWVSLGVSILLGGAIALIRAPQPESRSRDSGDPPPHVGLSRLSPSDVDAVTREEAEFRDPTPLFLPTPWNAGSNVGPPVVAIGPDSRFADYPAKLTQPAKGVRLEFASSVDLPASPAAALRVGERLNPFGALGRIDKNLPSLPERFAYIDVIRASDGAHVVSESIEAQAALVQPDWQPMELFVGVDSAGMVASVVLASSGIEEWDATMRQFLQKTFRLGERLRPGFYRVSVGP